MSFTFLSRAELLSLSLSFSDVVSESDDKTTDWAFFLLDLSDVGFDAEDFRAIFFFGTGASGGAFLFLDDDVAVAVLFAVDEEPSVAAAWRRGGLKGKRLRLACAASKLVTGILK